MFVLSAIAVGNLSGLIDAGALALIGRRALPLRRHLFRVYGRLNVTWVTPLGEDVASTS